VFDVNGRIVENILNRELNPGEYTLFYDASDIPSGIYFYRLFAGENDFIRKMILIK